MSFYGPINVVEGLQKNYEVVGWTGCPIYNSKSELFSEKEIAFAHCDVEFII